VVPERGAQFKRATAKRAKRPRSPKRPDLLALAIDHALEHDLRFRVRKPHVREHHVERHGAAVARSAVGNLLGLGGRRCYVTALGLRTPSPFGRHLGASLNSFE
jgi:hypothetical protein